MIRHAIARRIDIAAAAVLLALLASRAPGGTVTYHLTDLTASLDVSSYAQAINSSGQVTGYFYQNGGNHAFIYTAGSFSDIGPVVGNGKAYAINASGQTAGEANAYGFFYDGSMHGLGALGGDFSRANGVNAGGQSVGYSYISDERTEHAFLYSGGTMSDLGAFGGSSSAARGVNDSGQVVGVYNLALIGPYHAFLYSGGKMNDINPPHATDSVATAINALGQIVGLADNGGFLYTAGTFTNLGSLPGATALEPDAINSSGQIVGDCFIRVDLSDSTPHAFIYSAGAVSDLNSLVDSSAQGWDLQYATGINDSGWIAGWGLTPENQQHAFLLTPDVPEPSVAGMAGLAGGVVMLIRRSRTRRGWKAG